MKHNTRDESLGLWLGVMGVTFFAMTVPMTRLATGTADAPQLSPWFVTFGRAVLAGCLSLLFLAVTRSPRPQRQHFQALGLAALGNAIGYPLFLGLALRHVTASHAAVITATLPLVTAAVAAWVMYQQASRGFWLCAVVGALLVMVFSVFRAHQLGHGWTPQWADVLLLVAVVAASVGYVYGAKITPALGAERVICWVCVLALPVTVPGMLLTWPTQAVAASAWGGFIYVGIFSMWIGFFAWYRGLALGGALRVSQMQLLQPFLSILFAIPVLGEVLDPVTLLFASGVVATIFLSKRFAIQAAPQSATPKA
jgi:drug/metabolite transporter (DMT)-like permease